MPEIERRARRPDAVVIWAESTVDLSRAYGNVL